jgi:hypothetical protein
MSLLPSAAAAFRRKGGAHNSTVSFHIQPSIVVEQPQSLLAGVLCSLWNKRHMIASIRRSSSTTGLPKPHSDFRFSSTNPLNSLP